MPLHGDHILKKEKMPAYRASQSALHAMVEMLPVVVSEKFLHKTSDDMRLRL
jgi:hypothetical protein